MSDFADDDWNPSGKRKGPLSPFGLDKLRTMMVHHQATRNPKAHIMLALGLVAFFILLLKMFVPAPAGYSDEEFPGIVVRTLDQLPLDPVRLDNPNAARRRVILRPREVPHLSRYEELIVAPQGDLDWHVAPGLYEVFTCLQGSGVLSVARDPKVHPTENPAQPVRDTPLTPGVTVMVRPSFYYAVKNTGESDLLLIAISVPEKRN